MFWNGHNAIRDWVCEHRKAALAIWLAFAAAMQLAAHG
jgi:hypothetical protein